jgi:hypothetical protein
MPVRKGTCINFGPCPKADGHAVIEIQEGEEFICPFPGCRKPLQPLMTPRRGPKPGVIIAGCLGALIVVIGVAIWHPLRHSVSGAPSGHPSGSSLSKANAPDPCAETDWANAEAKYVLSTDCKGHGIADYDKRRASIESANRTEDSTNVKTDGARRHYLTPVPPPPGPDWPKASCEQVKDAWQGEDSRLNTPKCEGSGLSPAACAHIQRCLGLHLNTGPGSPPE